MKSSDKDTTDKNLNPTELEIRLNVRNVSLSLPTKEAEVTNIFRHLREPICLFGEDNYDKRKRLKSTLITKYNDFVLSKEKKQIDPEELESFKEVIATYHIDLSNLFDVGSYELARIKDLEKKVQDKALEIELKNSKKAGKDIRTKFYSEGTEELQNARLDITLQTIPRIFLYKEMITSFQLKYTKEEYDSYIESFNEHIKENLELHISQTGDNRPLTMGRFSPDLSFFAVSSFNSHINLFNYKDDNYSLKKTLSKGHTDKIHCISWNFPNYFSYYCSKDYTQIEKEELLLASCSSDKTVCVWKPFGPDERENETLLNGMSSETSDNSSALLCKIQAHDQRINKVIFHPVDKYILTCSEDETIKMFDITRGNDSELFYQEGHNANVYTIALNPYGNLYISGDSKGGILLGDLRTGRSIEKRVIHDKCIMNICFNPFFPNMFCTCGADNTIKVMDLRNFNVTCTILAHNKIITDAQFEPMYGRYLVSSSFDTFIKVWDSVHFYCTKILYNNNKIRTVDISPNGEYIATTSFDRTWKLYTQPSFEKENILSYSV